MRVTAGIFKGRKLIDNKFEHIRPTADIVKQAIFNKISSKVFSSKFLDLFCGTGAIGIEAISRGAREVVFADKDYRSVNLTKNNLKNLNIEAQVLNLDFKKCLSFLKGQKFDIIFIDPPYKSGVYESVLNMIFDFNLLNDDGIIICEQEKSYNIVQNYFDLVDEKYYGIKKISYFVKQKLS